MDVGSVEYLIPKGESTACFFDINPVSTYHPQVATLLGFDPYNKLAAWLTLQDLLNHIFACNYPLMDVGTNKNMCK